MSLGQAVESHTNFNIKIIRNITFQRVGWCCVYVKALHWIEFGPSDVNKMLCLVLVMDGGGTVFVWARTQAWIIARINRFPISSGETEVESEWVCRDVKAFLYHIIHRFNERCIVSSTMQVQLLFKLRLHLRHRSNNKICI